jgi:hypothetical protein
VVAPAWLGGLAFAAAPGTQYPSQKIIFTDPLSGRTVWRMTTDGAQLGATHLAPGDQSSESRSFSPDSTLIVYAKSGIGATKPDGVYIMDIASGRETFLAPAPWYAQPVFARDGSNEVYYYYGRLEVRAVNTKTFAARTVASLTGATWQEKLEVNADGSYISTHPNMGNGYRTVIFTPQGSFHPNWMPSGPVSDDGAVWSPTNPAWICAVRNGQGTFWNIHTLTTKSTGCTPAHGAWHPNGMWWFTPAYLVDINTRTDVLPGTGMGPIHPDINPAEAGLGTAAHVTADDRGSFTGTLGPRLYLPTLEALLAAARSGDWHVPSALGAVHYSTMNTNGAHIHAHWSFDGQYILWTSDVADLRDGTPPGGTGRGQDLFILPMGGGNKSLSLPPSPPTLSVSPESLAFSAVQGGATPAAQTLTISNVGGGAMTWTVGENTSWLTVSADGGAGDATLQVSAAPTGLVAGTYTAPITVTASGATGSPKSVGVTLTVSSVPQPLTVSFTSPTSGATVSGTTVVGMAVSNAQGQTKFKLSVDGVQVWSKTTTSSTIKYNWNTTGVTNNSHTLTIDVRDSNGKSATTSQTVTVSNGFGSDTGSNSTGGTTVSTTGSFTLSGTSLEFGAAANGQWVASTEGISVTTSPAGLAWTVSSGPSWLSVSPTSGSGNGAFFVLPSASGLAKGVYTTNLTVTGGGTSRMVAITFSVY